MEVEINDLASMGVIRDVEGYQLPPEAWTFGENVRFGDEGVERLLGRTQVFGTPGVAPHFTFPVSNSAQTWWLYTSLTKAYVYDGATHTNITRQSAGVDVDYTGSNTRDWNGTLLGGVPILNNGTDVPQFWNSYAASQKLANLTNWPAGYTARAIRAFGPHLVAFGVTKSGTEYPHLVLWSHPADPGSIPSSWDVADATKDAGEKDLPDVEAGLIRNALPLGSHMYVYKDVSVWRMSNIGGQFIFDFDPFLTTAGTLAPRCVTITGDGTRQVFATQDDILVHDGNRADSILDKRYKKTLFNQIDIDNYLNSFMFTNALRNEVWFCFPESGNINPTRALIWNYAEGRRGALSEVAINFRNAATGTIETAVDTVWSGTSDIWSSYVGPWSQTSRRKTVICATDSTKLLELDSGTLNDGSGFAGTLQRLGLAIAGRKRNGEWIVNYHSQKLVKRVWIKASGGPISVRVGAQSVVDGAVAWSTAKNFDPTTQKFLDFTISGKAVAVEFSASVAFRLLGYKLEGEVVSEF